jgi:hypothetical protein
MPTEEVIIRAAAIGRRVTAQMRPLLAAAKRTIELQARKWLRTFSFIAAPILGLAGVLLSLSFELGYWRTLPHSAKIAATIFIIMLLATLLLLYFVFIAMIVTWDIDRISYAVEEEAQRQFLKRIAPETRDPSRADESQIEPARAGIWGAPSVIGAALENLIERRAEFLWQNLLRSGCIDFPRADVKLAIKTIREENPVGDAGILDALKTLIVSRLFARQYIPRLRLKIMDKLVTKFVREISLLFISVWIVFLATVLLWSAVNPAIFLTRPDVRTAGVFVADLTLRGAIFTIVDHLGFSLTHLVPSANAKAFTFHTLIFRTFMSLFVIATIIKLLKLMLRRHAAA